MTKLNTLFHRAISKCECLNFVFNYCTVLNRCSTDLTSGYTSSLLMKSKLLHDVFTTDLMPYVAIKHGSDFGPDSLKVCIYINVYKP